MPRIETESIALPWQLPERRRTWRAPEGMEPSTEGAGTIGGLLLAWARTLAPGAEIGWEMGWDGERLVTQLFANVPEPTLGASLTVFEELEAMFSFADVGVVAHTPGASPPVVASVMPKAPGLHVSNLEGPRPMVLDPDFVTRCLRHLAGTAQPAPAEAPAVKKRRRARRTEPEAAPFLAAFRVRVSHRRSAGLQAALDALCRLPMQEHESSPFGTLPVTNAQEVRNAAEEAPTITIEVLAPRPLDRLGQFLVGKTWHGPLRKELTHASEPAAVALGKPGDSYVADALHAVFLLAPAFEQLRDEAPERDPREPDAADARGGGRPRSFPF